MQRRDGRLRLLRLLIANDGYATLLLPAVQHAAVDDATIAGEEVVHLCRRPGEGEATHEEDAVREGKWRRWDKERHRRGEGSSEGQGGEDAMPRWTSSRVWWWWWCDERLNVLLKEHRRGVIDRDGR
jgi:hypothetical protein